MAEKKIKYLRFLLKYPLYQIFKNRSQFISNKNFLVIASIIVGSVSAFAGITLKLLIHFIESLLLNKQFLELQYQLVFYPVFGIITSLILIKYVFKSIPFEKGLTNIIYKVKYRQSKVESIHTYAHLATSAVTVSLGGSVGVEAPIAITGSAIGSNIAKRLFVSPNDKALLLACGASAGISAIFNSPIAGVIFAFEVLLSSVSVSGFIPLLMASATAALINNFFYSGQLIVFNALPWHATEALYFTLLGIFCGIVSAYTIKTIFYIEDRFNNNTYKINKAIFQGLILGMIILASPLLYGEGYYVINQILAGEFDTFMQKLPLQDLVSYNTLLILFILFTILLKPIASGLTISAGGNGGIFAPSLFNGALAGLLFARILNTILPEPISELNFVIAGMAGLLSGVVSAPLTGIFMIAEVSGGYSLFVPLMIVSAVSFFTTRLFEPNSIYNKRIEDIGKMQTNKDDEILAKVNVDVITDKNFIRLQPNQYIKDIKNIVSKTSTNIYVVLNQDETLAGALTFNDLKPVLFNYSLLENAKVKDLMQSANIVLSTKDNLKKVKQIFEDFEEEYYLPVQDENEKFVGLISKSNFLNKYKELIQEMITD